MLNVTNKAVEILAEILEATDTEGAQCLRFEQSGPDSFGLALDEPREGDQVVSQGDRPILGIEDNIAAQLEGVTLGTEDSDEGPRLTLSSAA